ncbi:MAG TPA: hypothetical protein VFH73_09085 [Polyangia bacterium]|jgi:hypothetical protein|nr:hypothetical protein [Polyangia bacterium]
MRSPSNRRRDEILYSALALISGGILCVWGGLGPAQAEPPAAEPAAVAAPTVVPDGGAPATAPAPLSATVRIVFSTVPSAKAMVYWGKKRLGLIEPRKPLIVQRPRDSGPLDLMVRAEGFLPVQTRVYTFADGKIAVKLTPPDQKKTLLGYREPPPPDAGSQSGGGAPDGGVADPAAP